MAMVTILSVCYSITQLYHVRTCWEYTNDGGISMEVQWWEMEKICWTLTDMKPSMIRDITDGDAGWLQYTILQ